MLTNTAARLLRLLQASPAFLTLPCRGCAGARMLTNTAARLLRLLQASPAFLTLPCRGCAGARMLTNIGDANNLEGLGDLKKKDQASLHATCTPC